MNNSEEKDYYHEMCRYCIEREQKMASGNCHVCRYYKEDSMEEQAEYKPQKLDDRPSKTYPEKLDDRPARPVPKYESTDKPITLWAVLKIAPECSKITVPSFYETFNHFGLSNPIAYWKKSKLYNWLEKHPHAYPWFVEHGFLREAPEETYSVGDWFSIDGDFHNLVRVNSYSVCLINMRNSNRKRDPVIVKDSTEISRDEMIKIWGIDPVNIKKIPSPLTPSQ